MFEPPNICSLYRHHHAVLGLYLTNKCNMRCRHCGVNSGPEEHSHLELDGVLEHIRSFASHGILKGIHVSGGEPFLYPKDLKRIGRLGASLRLAVAVNSNGSWATSEDKAASILSSLPGVTQLILSTDRYHTEFAPIDRVINATRAARRLGLYVTIGVCVPDDEEGNEIEELRSGLGALGEDVEIGRQRLDVGGRAAVLPEAIRRGVSDKHPAGNCPQLNRPVIVEDGRLLACCNTTIVDTVHGSPLDGGRLDEKDSLARKLVRLKADGVLQAIRLFGPAFFADRLSTSGRVQLKGHYVIDDICDLCQDMMSRPDVVAEIEAISTSPATKQLVRMADFLAKSVR